MKTYTHRNMFSSNNIRPCGDNVYTLHHLLNDDLTYLPEGIKLQCPADLERLTTLAQNREAWANMTSLYMRNAPDQKPQRPPAREEERDNCVQREERDPVYD